jgi:hypothetical protein
MGARRDERFDSDLRIRLDHGDGLMRNVSASGVYFVTDVNLKPGQPLKFTLEFSGLQIGVVSARCEARVVRVEPQGALNGIGALFESIEFHRITSHPG